MAHRVLHDMTPHLSNFICYYTLLFIQLQSHQPPSSMTGMLLTQGLCTYCPCCLELSFLNYPYGWLTQQLQVFIQKLPTWRSLTKPPYIKHKCSSQRKPYINPSLLYFSLALILCKMFYNFIFDLYWLSFFLSRIYTPWQEFWSTLFPDIPQHLKMFLAHSRCPKGILCKYEWRKERMNEFHLAEANPLLNL